MTNIGIGKMSVCEFNVKSTLDGEGAQDFGSSGVGFSPYRGYCILLYLPTQLRFPIGGEQVKTH